MKRRDFIAYITAHKAVDILLLYTGQLVPAGCRHSTIVQLGSTSARKYKLKVSDTFYPLTATGKFSMYRLTLLTLVLSGLLSINGQAQSKLPRITAENPIPGRDTARDPEQDAHQDMLKELEVKRAETSYKQNIERAKEGAQLSVELRDTYAQQKALHPPELKKLARLEKLTRQLRSEAGGGDDEGQLKDPPNNLLGALERMADLATDLRKGVEKTPRQVISVSLITQTNELLELIRLARSFNK